MELLLGTKIKFVIDPARIKETISPTEIVGEQVCRLAKEKALHVGKRRQNQTILAADTMVSFRNQVIGKPKTISGAREILLKLRGKTHEVYTGICLSHFQKNKTVAWVCVTCVEFKKFSRKELEICLSTSTPTERAGGYSIQQHEDILIANLRGLRSNVIGLPIEEVLAKLGNF